MLLEIEAQGSGEFCVIVDERIAIAVGDHLGEFGNSALEDKRWSGVGLEHGPLLDFSSGSVRDTHLRNITRLVRFALHAICRPPACSQLEPHLYFKRATHLALKEFWVLPPLDYAIDGGAQS